MRVCAHAWKCANVTVHALRAEKCACNMWVYVHKQQHRQTKAPHCVQNEKRTCRSRLSCFARRAELGRIVVDTQYHLYLVTQETNLTKRIPRMNTLTNCQSTTQHYHRNWWNAKSRTTLNWDSMLRPSWNHSLTPRVWLRHVIDKLSWAFCKRTLYGQWTRPFCCAWLFITVFWKKRREAALKMGNVESQTTTSASETSCTRMTNDCFDEHMLRHRIILRLTRENVACAKWARCGVVFTPHVAFMGIAVACKRNFEKIEKIPSSQFPSCRWPYIRGKTTTKITKWPPYQACT